MIVPFYRARTNIAPLCFSLIESLSRRFSDVCIILHYYGRCAWPRAAEMDIFVRAMAPETCWLNFNRRFALLRILFLFLRGVTSIYRGDADVRPSAQVLSFRLVSFYLIQFCIYALRYFITSFNYFFCYFFLRTIFSRYFFFFFFYQFYFMR